ncbi:SDR family oxidoreductase [Actinomadura sp. WMMA1423]|uniref:SDR family oxidoreductase n=1 Tax=Actinomadura sp. WMMA1423 TaxID=2591108 RepID=UPI00143CFAD3|nr:SDR family oxidoreductase [Actinomadura sp. WMMA1423]
MTSIEEIARAYWRAEESRDVGRILTYFTDDADWSAPGLSARGPAEIGAFYAASAEAFPGLVVTVGRVLGGDDEAAIEWSAVFTDPAGTEVNASGTNIMRRRGDRIASLTVYMDPQPIQPPAGRFAGLHVLVTGAGSGIGAATARRFVEEGATVTGADVNAAGLAATRERLGAGAARFRPVEADITDPEAQRALVSSALGPDGGLDVLVNNAAVFLLAGTDATPEQWSRTLEVNVLAPAQLTAVAADALAASGHGAVVNVASISGHVGQRDRQTYNTAKGAVLALTRCQALDLADRGIRVNSVSPGYIWTEVLDRGAGGDRAAWEPVWGAFCMQRRCGEPGEVAAAIAYLASDDASFVTGNDLLVDGGLASMSPDGQATYEFG